MMRFFSILFLIICLPILIPFAAIAMTGMIILLLAELLWNLLFCAVTGKWGGK